MDHPMIREIEMYGELKDSPFVGLPEDHEDEEE